MPDASSQVIVEFESGTTVEILKNSLPLDRVCHDNTNIVHNVDVLWNVYSSITRTGFTQSFLNELKGMAKLSGTSYEMVLER